MTQGLERRYGLGDLHFVTFSCYRRLALLGEARARDVFVQTLGRMRERYRFGLAGYVVMPEHVHLLITEASTASPSVVLKALKQCVSRDLRASGCHKSVRQRNPANSKWGQELAHFWQPRFYDFNVYTSGKLKEKLQYMHLNPVARRLVNHPELWSWSSYLFYEKGEKGLIGIDPMN